MLHDIDATTSGRTNPTVSSDDKVVSPMAHQTNSSSYTAPGQSPSKQRMVFKNNMLVCYDSNNKISSVYGWVTAAGTIPVLISVIPNGDVFTDILGVPRPSGL